MRTAARFLVTLLLATVSCAPDKGSEVTKEIATKVFCYDLLQVGGQGGGAFSYVNLWEPDIDASTFEEDAALFRAAGDPETADRIQGFVDDLVTTDRELHVFLASSASEGDIEDVRALIESQSGVGDVEFVSSEQAFDEFSGEFATEPEILNDLPADSFPASFRVKFDANADLETAREELGELEAVEEARSAGGAAAAVATEMAAEFQELCRFGS